ncbi:hypothetical protein QMK19_21530 [Streptomyces sp. H10-C2]|uniref:hypothetical protein n=1 Tax=unclassified Streptomyces TaxID=2593676 RepID=UPI0024BAC3E7|nr:MULTISPECIES: hypothetical protein [unclassified Streptomyces]MDJ0342320.1 hypothetical protein [Streptomyces sp. PH10-H1]MDJ0372175.1 hypothetical protein [Streptomyces sp. H10-C2]
MTSPKKRTRRERTQKAPAYVMGAIPDDTFGAATDPPPPKGPEAPPLTVSKRFKYLLDNPDLYTAVSAFPSPSRVGRPAVHPPIAYLVFLCAISLFGSARATASHFEEEQWWDVVRQGVRTHMGDEAADALRSTGPTRSQWNYFFHMILPHEAQARLRKPA